MNTSVLLAAEGDDNAFSGLQAARAFIEVSERRFSRFLPDSELSLLNRSAGEWQLISADLMDLLTLSVKYYHKTQGLFNPSILPDLKLAGYDKSMDEIREHGASIISDRVHQARNPLTDIEIDFSRRRVRMPITMEIDLGGIAKGWIVEKAADLLRSYAPVCAVSAGGDICFIGNPSPDNKWRVELEDPRNPELTAAIFYVGQCSVVTSSITKRTWNQNGRINHHLIDPRTGKSAETDWLSVTVINFEITEAEAFAKALLIGGKSEADRLITKDPELAFITVDHDGTISGSHFGKEFLNEYNSIAG